MARILVISSEVVRGYVGASCARFALETMGHEAWVLPTVLLSNHPGHAVSGGARTDPGLLARMFDALDGNGWLADIDAVLTGYLPSEAHVAFAATAIARVRAAKQGIPIVCDTVLGDDPKGLYIDVAAAEAIRDRLVPLADVVTPNRFELSWLTGERIGSDIAATYRSARRLAVPSAVVTSLPGATPATLVNLLCEEAAATVARVDQVPKAPNGTGDLLAALLTGGLARGESVPVALRRAVAIVDFVVDRSRTSHSLNLTAARDGWDLLTPWPVEVWRYAMESGEMARSLP